jgi:hypothetical protein
MSVPTSDRGGIQQVIRTLKAAGYELDSVWDGEESTKVSNETEALAVIMELDQATLYVGKDGHSTSYVFFVLGNAPDEVVCDYTVDLTPVDALIDEWIS